MDIASITGSQERIAEIIGSLDTIATLPEITTRIIATVNDPNSSAADLHRLISHDPALVSRILKLVNSSFYARAHRVDSVDRAIVLLGFGTVHHLAIAATLGQLFPNVKLCDGFRAKDIWTHSIAVGVTAREIASRICKSMAEEAFLAGLVHDVGLLAILEAQPEQLRQICTAAKTQPTPFGTLELGVVGVDHQELGAALAKRWGFPPACRAIAGAHHNPSLADDEWQTLAAVVHVADTLCCSERIGFYLTACTQLPDEMAFKGLVPLSVVESTRDHLHELVAAALRIFA
jgi:putative nucleotidyltransferase with HDIG domain